MMFSMTALTASSASMAEASSALSIPAAKWSMASASSSSTPRRFSMALSASHYSHLAFTARRNRSAIVSLLASIFSRV